MTFQDAAESAAEETAAITEPAETSGFDLQAVAEQGMAFVVDKGMDVVAAIVVLIVGLWLSKKIRSWVVTGLSKTNKIDETVGRFLGSLAYYAAVLITIVAVLGEFGVETTSFVAIFGAMGLAVGLALQGTLGHVAAGVMLLIFRPFKIGQFVEIAGQSGTVKAITLFTTEMDTGDNVRIIIPNGAVWGSSVVNYSFNDTRRVDFVFGIGYGDDINKAMETIGGCLATDERIHKDPEPFLVVSNLNDSSVDITVRVWVDAGDYWGVKFAMTKAVKEAMDRDGIDIPYPQSVVHHQNN